MKSPLVTHPLMGLIDAQLQGVESDFSSWKQRFNPETDTREFSAPSLIGRCLALNERLKLESESPETSERRKGESQQEAAFFFYLAMLLLNHETADREGLQLRSDGRKGWVVSTALRRVSE